MVRDIPYVNPTMILKFFNEFPLKLIDKLEESGKLNPLEGGSFTYKNPRLIDYYAKIPSEYREKRPFIMEYHNALLRMTQKLVNEGLLTPVGDGTGLEQRYSGNGLKSRELLEYGYYDYWILGFQAIRNHFEKSIVPIIVNQGVPEKSEDIGTGYIIEHKSQRYFITAKHCFPQDSLITIRGIAAENYPLIPDEIIVPENENIDIAVIELPFSRDINYSPLFIDSPQVLDEVITMGYPPIPGFTEAVQIAEKSAIATSLKSSTGEITGKGKHYWGGLQDHFLISARVKGGCSGSPVINKYGMAVGVVLEILKTDNLPDRLGYGVAISNDVVIDLLNTHKNIEDKIPVRKLQVKERSNGFTIGKS